MGCYKPRLACKDLSQMKQAQDGHYFYPTKFIQKAKNWEEAEKVKTGYSDYFLVPCKKCIGCQLDYSQDWATRCYLESLYTKDNYFVTLTYDDEHLPRPESIETSRSHMIFDKEACNEQGYQWHYCCNDPDDIKKFMHDLRQYITRHPKIFPEGSKVRFIACEEYGSEGWRTHLHLILMDCYLPLSSFYVSWIDWKKDIHWNNSILEKIWGKGRVDVMEANYEAMAYVARYATKKVMNTADEVEYGARGMLKEVFRQSRNPGIGWQYYQDHKEEIYEHDYVFVKTKKGVEKRRPPEYYDRMFEKEFPEKMKEIKKKRYLKMLSNLRLKAQSTSLTYEEQLALELNSKEDVTKALTRNKADDKQLGIIRRVI